MNVQGTRRTRCIRFRSPSSAAVSRLCGRVRERPDGWSGGPSPARVVLAPTTPAPTDTAPGKGASCHGAYLADVDTSVPGEATPEAAAVAWAKSVNAPPGAPTDGWKATDERKERSRERTVRSGDWIVGLSSTVPVGWVVRA
jgi:hypothetical protein